MESVVGSAAVAKPFVGLDTSLLPIASPKNSRNSRTKVNTRLCIACKLTLAKRQFLVTNFIFPRLFQKITL